MAARSSAQSLADALPDFGKVLRLPLAASGGRSAPEPVAVAFPMVFAPAGPSETEVGERIASAVAIAKQALSETLAADHDTAIEALAAAHQAEIDAIRQACGEDLATVLLSQMAGLETRVASLTTAVAARILGILASEQIARRAVDRLAAAIREAIADSDAIRIEVKGPQSLFESLASAMGERSSQLRFTEGPGVDLVASLDDAQFETRLADWSASLEGILS